MDRGAAVLLTALVGGLIALQAPINSMLGRVGRHVAGRVRLVRDRHGRARRHRGAVHRRPAASSPRPRGLLVLPDRRAARRRVRHDRPRDRAHARRRRRHRRDDRRPAGDVGGRRPARVARRGEAADHRGARRWHRAARVGTYLVVRDVARTARCSRTSSPASRGTSAARTLGGRGALSHDLKRRIDRPAPLAPGHTPSVLRPRGAGHVECVARSRLGSAAGHGGRRRRTASSRCARVTGRRASAVAVTRGARPVDPTAAQSIASHAGAHRRRARRRDPRRVAELGRRRRRRAALTGVRSTRGQLVGRRDGEVLYSDEPRLDRRALPARRGRRRDLRAAVTAAASSATSPSRRTTFEREQGRLAGGLRRRPARRRHPAAVRDATGPSARVTADGHAAASGSGAADHRGAASCSCSSRCGSPGRSGAGCSAGTAPRDASCQRGRGLGAGTPPDRAPTFHDGVVADRRGRRGRARAARARRPTAGASDEDAAARAPLDRAAAAQARARACARGSVEMHPPTARPSALDGGAARPAAARWRPRGIGDDADVDGGLDRGRRSRRTVLV